MLRTDYLVHWTGKDIQVDHSKLDSAQRTAYVERVLSILEGGFWVTDPLEHVRGKDAAWFKYQAPMVCFTEIRLSRAEQHSVRYGLAGVVVNRGFVLTRLGTPVLNARNHAIESLVSNVNVVVDYLTPQVATNTGAANALGALGDVIGRLKGMSSPDSDDFQFLEEQEWRIIHRDPLVKDGLMKACPNPPPKFRLKIEPQEVGGLVLPDAITRSLLLSDGRFRTWLAKRDPLAFTLTVEECLLF